MNMKVKRFAVVAIMMVVALSASAQFEPGKWAMQFRFGFGASQLSNMEKIPMGGGELDTQFKGASSWGLDFEYQATKLLGVSIGLNRTSQGSAWEDYTDATQVKYKDPEVDLDYINVPLIANFYVTKGLALKTGLQLGYLINADLSMHTESSFEGRDLTTKTTLDIEKDCNKIDLSIPVGISYEFPSHFVIDARYNIGLTKVNKEDVFGPKDNKNGVFMLSFGYKFDL